jgi:hypothetical protein
MVIIRVIDPVSSGVVPYIELDNETMGDAGVTHARTIITQCCRGEILNDKSKAIGTPIYLEAEGGGEAVRKSFA